LTELQTNQVKSAPFIITEAVGLFSMILKYNGTFNKSRIFQFCGYCTLLLLIKVNFICISSQAQCLTVKSAFTRNKLVILLVTALPNAKRL